jgi:hypothetical protein
MILLFRYPPFLEGTHQGKEMNARAGEAHGRLNNPVPARGKNIHNSPSSSSPDGNSKAAILPIALPAMPWMEASK